MLRYAIKYNLQGKLMYKIASMAVISGSLLFLGCSSKEPNKEVIAQEATASNDIYTKVINKSIQECQEHNITLDSKRTNEFMRRSPKKTIEVAAQETAKTPKKLCQFFAEETSVEKIEQSLVLANRIIQSCQKVGVNLPKDAIENKVRTLPFFVIRKGLSMNKESSLEECNLMQKKY
ncbi:MAG: Unknown protein [uncultured Sulfurovum sp.]|uniref:Lipoprotein n=1 Tax=uncultured Sulfurovum sp. TaxID=269237 RepID=A0A6S6SUP8_9BACT|nr:MAG: Unknown protein [uncultured Sulfurovum sp.]